MSGSPIDRVMDTGEWTPVNGTPDPNDPSGPYVTHEGVVTIFDTSLRCFQTSDGKRYFYCEDIERLFGLEPHDPATAEGDKK